MEAPAEDGGSTVKAMAAGSPEFSPSKRKLSPDPWNNHPSKPEGGEMDVDPEWDELAEARAAMQYAAPDDDDDLPRPAKRPRHSAPDGAAVGDNGSARALPGDAEVRAAQLRAHPLARVVEPDRVYCDECEKWVRLGQYAYYLHHWYQHLNTIHNGSKIQKRTPAKQPSLQPLQMPLQDSQAESHSLLASGTATPVRPARTIRITHNAKRPVSPASPASTDSASAPATPVKKESRPIPPPLEVGETVLIDGKLVQLPSKPLSEELTPGRMRNYKPVGSGKRAPLRNELQRLAELVVDAEVYSLELYRVRCRRCMRWVTLGSRGPYYTGQWQKHKEKCRGTCAGVHTSLEEAEEEARIRARARVHAMDVRANLHPTVVHLANSYVGANGLAGQGSSASANATATVKREQTEDPSVPSSNGHALSNGHAASTSTSTVPRPVSAPAPPASASAPVEDEQGDDADWALPEEVHLQASASAPTDPAPVDVQLPVPAPPVRPKSAAVPSTSSSSSSKPLMTRAPLPPRAHTFYAPPVGSSTASYLGGEDGEHGPAPPTPTPMPVVLDTETAPPLPHEEIQLQEGASGSIGSTPEPNSSAAHASEVVSASTSARQSVDPSVPLDLPTGSALLAANAEGRAEQLLERRIAGNREREYAFRSDPMVAEVEPSRVKCAMCGTWLKLSTERDYCPHHWAVHKKRCKERDSWLRVHGGPPKAPKPPRKSSGAPGHAHGHGPLFTNHPLPAYIPGPPGSGVAYVPVPMPLSMQGLPPPPPSEPRRLRALPPQNYTLPHLMTPPPPPSAQLKREDSSHTTVQVRTTDVDRRRALEADPDVRAVRPDAVQCNMCAKWIKLSNSHSYAPGNWSGYKGHKVRCRERNPQLTRDHNFIVGGPPVFADRPPPAPALAAASSSLPRIQKPVSTRVPKSEEALRADERVRKVENGRLQCNLCGKWLKIPNFRTHLQNKCRARAVKDYDPEDDVISDGDGGYGPADVPTTKVEPDEWKEDQMSDLTEVESSSEEERWVRSPTPPPKRPLSPQPDYAARYALYLNPLASRMAAPGVFSGSTLKSRFGFSVAHFGRPAETQENDVDNDNATVPMLTDSSTSASGPSPLTPADATRLAGDMSTRLFLTQPAPRPCPYPADEDADAKPLDYIYKAGYAVPPPPLSRPRA